MSRIRTRWTGRGWIRLWLLRAHRHVGLFVGPTLFIFAITTLVLNHVSRPEPEGAPAAIFENLRIADLDGLPLARSLIAQMSLDGEVDWVRKEPAHGSILILLSRPGQRSEIRVETKESRAEVYTQFLSFWDRLVYLHKRPGPHVAAIRGNWWFVKIWRGVADSTVAAIFILTLSGIYLWWKIRRERRRGLAFLLAGAALANGMLFWLVG